MVTGLGMSYFDIPVDFANPTLDDLRAFIGTMEAMKGRKVWVHCVVDAHLVVDGASGTIEFLVKVQREGE